MKLDLKLRCTSRAHFEVWMVNQGFATLDDNKFTLKEGVQIAEIGPITQTPAVYDKPGGKVVTPAVVDTAYHADLRVYSVNYYKRESLDREARNKVVLAGSYDLPPDLYETVTAAPEVEVKVDGGGAVAIDAVAEPAVFTTTAIGADFASKTEQVEEVVNGVKRAPGYVDVAAGVAIVTPATPRHEWC